VNAARLLFERVAHSRDAQDSFKVFNIVRSLRYLVTSTIQVNTAHALIHNIRLLVHEGVAVVNESITHPE
jgi:hypothetical protein